MAIDRLDTLLINTQDSTKFLLSLIDQSRFWVNGLFRIRSIQRVFDYDVTAIKTDNERGYGVSLNFEHELCGDLGILYEAWAEYTEEKNRLGE
jgi:hypothetical protein